MRTALAPLELLEPRSLRDALRLLRDEAPLTPVAGGTDIYVSANAGTLAARRFIDLWRLDALRGIEARRGGSLWIGALTTFTQIIRSPEVHLHLPMLVEAARQIGGPQVQNRGTIGGNVANASPAGDTLPVLAVAEATVVLRNLDEERRVPFLGFYSGYRKTVMRPDELVAGLEIPPLEGRQWFRKVGSRAAQTISKVVMAAVRPRGGPPRIALGSVAPTVVRARDTEAVLGAGGTLDEAEPTLAWEITPIDDARSTAEYRRRVAVNLLARFWEDTGDAIASDF